MKVKIKRIDKTLPLPEYHTSGAVAFDIYSRVDMDIGPKELVRIPSNLTIEIPAGYMILLKDRSSTAKKKGLFCTVGYVDQDYCGEEDEILLQSYNFTEKLVKVERGERLGQAAFVPIEIVEFDEVDSMSHNKTRGGFGSTDVKK